MDSPPTNEFWATVGAALGGIATGALGFWAAFRRWARHEHAEDRREGAEDRRDRIDAKAENKAIKYLEIVIKTMQEQILALTNDGITIRAQLAICEKQHAECREITDSQRLQIDGMSRRIEELEVKLYE